MVFLTTPKPAPQKGVFSFYKSILGNLSQFLLPSALWVLLVPMSKTQFPTPLLSSCFHLSSQTSLELTHGSHHFLGFWTNVHPHLLLCIPCFPSIQILVKPHLSPPLKCPAEISSLSPSLAEESNSNHRCRLTEEFISQHQRTEPRQQFSNSSLECWFTWHFCHKTNFPKWWNGHLEKCYFLFNSVMLSLRLSQLATTYPLHFPHFSKDELNFFSSSCQFWAKQPPFFHVNPERLIFIGLIWESSTCRFVQHGNWRDQELLQLCKISKYPCTSSVPWWCGGWHVVSPSISACGPNHLNLVFPLHHSFSRKSVLLWTLLTTHGQDCDLHSFSLNEAEKWVCQRNPESFILISTETA